jgi:hypothetical protein
MIDIRFYLIQLHEPKPRDFFDICLIFFFRDSSFFVLSVSGQNLGCSARQVEVHAALPAVPLSVVSQMFNLQKQMF